MSAKTRNPKSKTKSRAKPRPKTKLSKKTARRRPISLALVVVLVITLIGSITAWQSQPHKAKPSLRDDKKTPVALLASHPDAPQTPDAPVLPRIVPEKQNLPQEDGLAPVIFRVQTAAPVVFLTIDDGWTKSPEALDWFKKHPLPASMFLTDDAIKDDYPYFQQLQAVGMSVEDHTVHHPVMTRLGLGAQQAEICGASDKQASVFGRRPSLFRPPYGAYNNLTRQVARDCGMKAVVNWDVTINNGSLQYLKDISNLRPGDIVLMHFRPSFVQDIEAFMARVKQDNLQVGRLEDWL